MHELIQSTGTPSYHTSSLGKVHKFMNNLLVESGCELSSKSYIQSVKPFICLVIYSDGGTETACS